MYLRRQKPQENKYRNARFKYSKEQETYEKQLREYESKIVPKLGEFGEPAYLEGKDKEEGEKALKKVALNTVLSDRMPLNRTLRDPRHKK